MKKSLLNKITIYSLAIFIGTILLAVAICTTTNIRQTLNVTANATRSVTQIVSQLASKYDMDRLAQDPDSEEYQELVTTLRSICNNDGVEYIYIYVPDMENNELTFVIGVASDERKSQGTVEKSQAGTVIAHQFLEGEIHAWNGETENVSSVRSNERYGRQMCTYALITNQNGEPAALVGADYSIDKIYNEIISATAVKMLKVVIVLAVIFVLAAFFIKKKIYDPITFLFENVKSYISNKTDDNRSFEPIKLNTNDEIQRLADYFNEMVSDVDSYADRVKMLAGQQAKADTELEVAKRIQYGIMGEKKDSCLAHNFMISARMKSARQVGGDFYDSFLLKNGKVCVFIGDVSGKGIAAALFMVFIKTLMREKLTDIPYLAQAIAEVNREICNSNPEGMFATSFIAVFDKKTGTFEYVNAGHNKPVIIHNGKAEFLECRPCIALGIFDDSEYEQHEMAFTSGDILYLYTDGVTEAVNGDKKFYGEEMLLDACNSSEQTANGVCVKVSDSLKNFMGDATEQFDDITMLAVEQRGQSLELASEMSELGKIKDCIFDLPVDNGQKKKIFLACEEIFSNIANYSEARDVEFCYYKNADSVTVIFIDDGKLFNPLERKNEKDFDDFDEGGMGISLVKELCSGIHYNNTDGKNVLSLEFADK